MLINIIINMPNNLSLLELFDFKNEEKVLIQGLPSNIERHFTKIGFSKNVTPLLCNKKADFVLIFAVNQKQLNDIFPEILHVLHEHSNFWIAYPKRTSKVLTDLHKKESWELVHNKKYKPVKTIDIDHVWLAEKFALIF